MGRKGGLARIRTHGNPGTLEGRRRGGRNSLATHYKLKTGFKLLRTVQFPSESAELAELMGAWAGDGHVGEYQAGLTTNSETDLEHARHVKNLVERLFAVPVTLRRRVDAKACTVIVSSKEFCRFLISKGMVRGKKIKGGIRIPAWVRGRARYHHAFIRGLFDTDGCVYVDRHVIRGREYRNIGIAFTNRALQLLSDFRNALTAFGFHPTQKTKFVVFLRREEEIKRYFEVIGSSNPKHLKKVSLYFSAQRRSARNW